MENNSYFNEFMINKNESIEKIPVAISENFF